jgi:1-acyl-sn-glycerol-3-phosphate acyltransferase
MKREWRDRYFDNLVGAPEAPSTWLFKLFDVVGGFLWRVLFRLTVEGRENLDGYGVHGGKGAVISANHVSLCDPPTLWLAVRPGIPRMMGKESVFTKATLLVADGGAMLGAFPIKRNVADRKAIKRAISFLRGGELVGIFPEGTRMRLPGMVPQYHAGTALIASMAGVPIIPVGIRGTDKVCPGGTHILHFPKVTVAFGKPIDPKDFNHLPKKERSDAILNEVMRNIFALRDGVPIDQVPADVIGLVERRAALSDAVAQGDTVDPAVSATSDGAPLCSDASRLPRT